MTNRDAHLFIKNNFSQHYADLYLKAHVPYCQADFWRYLVLQKFGGVYVDLDILVMSPMENWLNLDADISLFKSHQSQVSTWNMETYDQWVIGATKENNGMLGVVQAVASRLELAEVGGVTYNDTGSAVFTKAIQDSGASVFINNGPPDNVIHYSGARLWSEGLAGQSMSHIYPWINKQSVDIKLNGDAYNSKDGF